MRERSKRSGALSRVQGVMAVTFRGGATMQRLRSLLLGVGSLALGVLFLSIAGTSAKQEPKYPLDDKMARDTAQWTVPGKWGKSDTRGRWGEQNNRVRHMVIRQ